MTAEKRIEESIKGIDCHLHLLVHRPGMYVGNSDMHTAELLLRHNLWTRADLCGGILDIRRWYNERYPEVPGNVRDISRYILGWNDDNRAENLDIHHHLDAWKKEAGGLVRWSIEQMQQ